MKLISSNILKIIAILAMALDHAAYAFIPNTCLIYYIFRLIGRITAPIMFFCLANGFCYTKNKFKYGLRLLFFAILSQIPYSLFVGDKIFLYDNYNVIFTLFLGFMCLVALVDVKKIFYKIAIIILCLGLSLFCEYELFGIFLIIAFYVFKERKWQILIYSVFSFAYLAISSLVNNSTLNFVVFSGLFFVVPLLILYNGKRGKFNLKYLFYLFYPFHLILLFIIKMIV
jgi:hypothetical protein